jgi:3-hydroxyisobutyrate dehydrogenase
VLLGPADSLADMIGGTVVVHSTVHPATCHEVADAAGGRGISVVDAPVSGGGGAAAAGALLVLVGGRTSDVEVARPVLSTFGNPVVHLGPLGSGQVAKLINNALMGAQLGLADDALRVGASLGLDSDSLAEALIHGTGASYSLGIRRQLPLQHFPAWGLLRKDLDLLGAVAESADTDLGPLGDAAEALLERLESIARSAPTD